MPVPTPTNIDPEFEQLWQTILGQFYVPGVPTRPGLSGPITQEKTDEYNQFIKERDQATQLFNTIVGQLSQQTNQGEQTRLTLEQEQQGAAEQLAAEQAGDLVLSAQEHEQNLAILDAKSEDDLADILAQGEQDRLTATEEGIIAEAKAEQDALRAIVEAGNNAAIAADVITEQHRLDLIEAGNQAAIELAQSIQETDNDERLANVGAQLEIERINEAGRIADEAQAAAHEQNLIALGEVERLNSLGRQEDAQLLLTQTQAEHQNELQQLAQISEQTKSELGFAGDIRQSLINFVFDKIEETRPSQSNLNEIFANAQQTVGLSSGPGGVEGLFDEGGPLASILSQFRNANAPSIQQAMEKLRKSAIQEGGAGSLQSGKFASANADLLSNLFGQQGLAEANITLGLVDPLLTNARSLFETNVDQLFPKLDPGDFLGGSFV